jgi:GTPase SAR1 family protein
MSKKIIFIGPSGAGKSTIRKMFFEGENSKKLLEYALEPTYGEESLILRLPGLKEDIGIFDLAGQENHRWLGTDDNEIFIDSQVILIVIDISTNYDLISEFVEKVLAVRNQRSPNSMIYLLLHKIDLINTNALKEVNAKVKKAFSGIKFFKVMFTSIKKRYLVKTFSYFLDIMKSCLLEKDSEEALEFNVIDESLKIISEIKKEVSISKKVLIEKLNRPDKLISYLLESLEKKNHITIQRIKNNDIISLTDFGRDYFSNVINSFSSNVELESTFKIEQDELSPKKKTFFFIGALISDKDGRSLLKIEISEELLNNLLFRMKKADTTSISTDLDLIPMFVSALEKFSLELNIHDLSGFDLSGSNLKLYVINYDLYNVILFMNPDVNLDPFEIRIRNYFSNIFEEHATLFNQCLETGQIDILLPIRKEIIQWFEKINQTYESMIINMEIVDVDHAKKLYDQMDDLYEKINQKFSLSLDKIKKLKVSLMKAILEKDYEELMFIADYAKNLSLEYAI